MESPSIVLQIRCALCLNQLELIVDRKAYEKYRQGMKVQDAFPDMPSKHRELLISRTCPACWENIFGSPPKEKPVFEPGINHMDTTQEPKYKIVGDTLVNRQSGEAIPDDEPVIVFRARDIHVTKVLAFYLSKVQDRFHREAVFRRLQQFHDWADKHPERMKEPDTELTADWPKMAHE